MICKLCMKDTSQKLSLTFAEHVACYLYTRQADIHLFLVSSHMSSPAIQLNFSVCTCKHTQPTFLEYHADLNSFLLAHIKGMKLLLFLTWIIISYNM